MKGCSILLFIREMQIKTKGGNDRISRIALLYASYEKTHQNDENQLFEILGTNQAHSEQVKRSSGISLRLGASWYFHFLGSHLHSSPSCTVALEVNSIKPQPKPALWQPLTGTEMELPPCDLTPGS